MMNLPAYKPMLLAAVVLWAQPLLAAVQGAGSYNAPTDTVPMDIVPTDGVPTDSASTGNARTDNAPTGITVTDSTATGSVPTESTPTERTATQSAVITSAATEHVAGASADTTIKSTSSATTSSETTYLATTSAETTAGNASQSSDAPSAQGEDGNDGTGHRVIVADAVIDLHTGPGRGYPIPLALVKGEALTLLHTRGNWVKVQCRGQHLWLNDNDLTKLRWPNGAPYVTSDAGEQAFKQRDVEVSAMFGDLNGASFYQVELGYRFSDVVSIGLSAGQANGANATSQIAEAHLYLDPFADWWVSPYLGIGGGVNRTVPRTILVQAIDRTDAIASAELGVRYYLARNFIARAAYHRGVLATSRNENDEITTWKLGVSVFF